ncbi:MAG: type II secretion system F family protein [Bacteriovoracaceae bacterium]|nr:type II secretion system F family protein [Bacteriovoracaceae bacterium]
MGTWKWEGLDIKGKKARGNILAQDIKEARKILRGQGIRPRRITPPSVLEFDISEWMVENGYASGFGTKELCQFTKQLSTMINAGVPIVQSLEILSKTEKHPVLKRTIKNISTEVSEGSTIADAMKKQKGFDKLYCNLVKAGEAGGILDGILIKLAEHMDKQQKTKAQIKSAMTYPAIVVVVGIAVVWGLMVFIVPQFMGMLSQSGQEIPAITQFVVDVSNMFQKYTMTALPIIILFLFLMKKYIATPLGKRQFDIVMMNLPIFGGVVVKGNLSSFSRTLATMLSAGVSLIDSLSICGDTIDNVVICDDISMIRDKIIEGKTMYEPLSRIKYFPDMVASMVKVGEQTGSMDTMFLKVSDVFEEEVNSLVDNMTKMIEPIIIVVLGGMVATILVAMYLPIFMSAG